MQVRHVTNNVILRATQKRWDNARPADVAPEVPRGKGKSKAADVLEASAEVPGAPPVPPLKAPRTNPSSTIAPGKYSEKDIPSLMNESDASYTVTASFDPGSDQAFSTISMPGNPKEDIVTLHYVTQRFTSGDYYNRSRANWIRRVREEAGNATSWDDLAVLDQHAAKLARLQHRDEALTQAGIEAFRVLVGAKFHAHSRSTLQFYMEMIVHKAAALYRAVRGAEDPTLSRFRLVFLVGNAQFSTTRGSRRFPLGKFVEFVSRFFAVVMVDEYMSSQTCVLGHFIGKAKKTALKRQRHSNAYFIRCTKCEEAGQSRERCHENGHDKDRIATLNFTRRVLAIALHGKIPRSLSRDQ